MNWKKVLSKAKEKFFSLHPPSPQKQLIKAKKENRESLYIMKSNTANTNHNGSRKKKKLK